MQKPPATSHVVSRDAKRYSSANPLMDLPQKYRDLAEEHNVSEICITHWRNVSLERENHITNRRFYCFPQLTELQSRVAVIDGKGRLKTLDLHKWRLDRLPVWAAERVLVGRG